MPAHVVENPENSNFHMKNHLSLSKGKKGKKNT